MHRADSFGARAVGNRQPVDQSEGRGNEAADDTGDDHPERDLRVDRVLGAEIDEIEYHGGRQQAERKHHQHLVDGMSQ